MKVLLTFEYRKLFRQKSFYVCGILLLAFVFFSAAVSRLAADNAQEIAAPLPTAIGMLRTALQGANATPIIGIFAALFVCGDHADGALKNIYAKGYTRTSVYFSKLIAAFSASVIFCFVTWCGAFIAGRIFFETGTGLERNTIAALAAQLLTVFGYTALFFALAAIIKKTGGSIAACIVGPMLFAILFTAADSVINSETIALSDYWLDGLFSGLMQPSAINRTVLLSALLSLAYAAVFTAVGCMFHKKSQL